MTPQLTFTILLAVQALHLLHHRASKRHISYAEVISALALCVPLTALPAAVLMVAHLGLASVQVVGSVWIRRLSPDWSQGPGLLERLG